MTKSNKDFGNAVGYICDCDKIFLSKDSSLLNSICPFIELGLIRNQSTYDWEIHKETCTKYKIEIEKEKERFN